MLKIAQEEYQRQLQEYLTNPLKKPKPDLNELIRKALAKWNFDETDSTN